MTLSPEECAEISWLAFGTGQKAEAGEDYERELRQEVVRLSAVPAGALGDIMERVAKRMTLEELKAVPKRRTVRKAVSWHPKPQLAGARG